MLDATTSLGKTPRRAKGSRGRVGGTRRLAGSTPAAEEPSSRVGRSTLPPMATCYVQPRMMCLEAELGGSWQMCCHESLVCMVIIYSLAQYMLSAVLAFLCYDKVHEATHC